MKLKHLAYILALGTILSGSAWADHVPGEIINPDEQADQQAEQDEAKLDKWSFECIPDVVKQKETDSIIRAYVTAIFEKPNWVLKDLSVQYKSFSGKIIDRADQYNPQANLFGRVDSKYLWMWGGNLKKDPRQQIMGGLIVDANKVWHYDERYLVSGKKKVKDFTSTCEEIKPD